MAFVVLKYTKVGLPVCLGFLGKMISTGPLCVHPLTIRAQLTATELGLHIFVVLHWEIAAQKAVASSAAHLLSFLLSRIRCVVFAETTHSLETQL